MRLIQSHTDYAVRAILFIAASEKEMVSSADLEAELDLPRPFMRRIMQDLQKAGILKSLRGYQGGFQLAKAPAEIFLMDLIELFQGGLDLTECIFRKKVCPNCKTCPIRRRVKKIENYVLRELQGINLAVLMQEK
ncbi:MAG: Rrf2 family transcriptional regulator [Candidatus Omnitrophica bacterium]|nr:Rrf2 family transcriptional regulator [Candidatus Omnitrophota bacterium]